MTAKNINDKCPKCSSDMIEHPSLLSMPLTSLFQSTSADTKNMSIEDQAAQVRKVKRSESGLIIDPVTLLVDATIGDAVHLMRENRIGGIPIVDSGGKLVGILTNRESDRAINYVANG